MVLSQSCAHPGSPEPEVSDAHTVKATLLGPALKTLRGRHQLASVSGCFSCHSEACFTPWGLQKEEGVGLPLSPETEGSSYRMGETRGKWGSPGRDFSRKVAASSGSGGCRQSLGCLGL